MPVAPHFGGSLALRISSTVLYGASARTKSSSLERVGLPIQLNLDQSNCASLRPMS